ncbi:MAG TPA: redox-sensing transcriptional repressor Rex, partial [Tepiditoga sp.]|nr:redox-sensing transcriptional repressor Rex [Tepiditoga sp.]
IDEKKIGRMIIPGVTINKFSEMSSIINENSIEIAILTVPAHESQNVADALVKSGIKGILNFTPSSLSVPENISVEDVDFVISLKSLTFEIASFNDNE